MPTNFPSWGHNREGLESHFREKLQIPDFHGRVGAGHRAKCNTTPADPLTCAVQFYQPCLKLVRLTTHVLRRRAVVCRLGLEPA